MLALLRAHKTQATNARERAIKAAAPYVSPNDPDAGLPDHGFYRRVGGSARDMPASQQSTLNEQAMTMRRQNPLARRYIDLVRELMTQSDWTVTAQEEPVQDVLDEFWAGPFNRWPEWIGPYGDVLHVTGVLGLPVWVNRYDGSVSCGYADPAEMSQPVPMPGNPKRIMSLTYTPAGATQGTPIKVVNPVLDRKGRYAEHYGRLMAEDPRKEHFTGILYFRSNALPNETAGLSDLSAAIDHLNNHSAYMDGQLELAMLLGRFAGEITVKDGANQKTINDLIERYRAEPMFGTVTVHNEQEEHDYTASSTMAADAADRDRMHGNYATASLGPPHILRGDMGEGNRAVATSASDPMYLKMQAKMRCLIGVSRFACQYAIDSAVITGHLSPSIDATFSIGTPKLLKKDLTAGADVLVKVSQFVAMAEQREWMGRATAQEVFVRMLPELGIDDLTLERVREDLETNGPAAQVYTPGVQDAIRQAVESGEGDETEDAA